MDWIWAGVAMISGFIAGGVFSRIAKQMLERRRGRMAQLGTAAASLVFSLTFVIGLLVALGFVQPDSLSKLRDDTIDYLPRVLSALIVVILGSVVGTIVSTAARESMARTLGRLGEQLPTAIKGIITAFSVILAASQLGIDTTVINIVVAATVAGLALACALVVGFGSRPVATELASGRVVRRLIAVGDRVTANDFDGTVVALHPTTVELTNDGSTTLLPNSVLAGGGFSLSRTVPHD